jgi:aspartyl/asparaginyl-tRNA synthetase
VVDNDFARITYTEAVELLQLHIKEKKVRNADVHEFIDSKIFV